MCDICGDLPCPLDLAESKSSAVERWANENGKPVFYVPAASTKPEDIFGPVPDLFGMEERAYGTPAPPCDFKTVLF